MAENIKIRDYVASNRALTLDEGDAVRNVIEPFLKDGKAVDLDFNGIEDVATAFLNTAIGRLYGEFPQSAIRRLLTVSALNTGAQRSLEKVLENAQRFYGHAEPKEA